MKRFLIALIIFIAIPLTAFAVSDEYNQYLEQYDLSCFDELSKDVKEILKELNINNFDYESISNLKFSDIIQIIKNIAIDKLSSPLKSCTTVMIFVLLSAFFQSIKPDSSNTLDDLYSTISAIIIALVLLIKISPTIKIASGSIGVASNFIFAFIPIFCSMVAVSGNVATSFSTNTMLLSLAQGLTFISSNVFVPLVNSFLAIGVCSGIRSQLNLSSLLSTVKKIITTSISFISAMFVSILSIKTAVASRSDILGIRSVRFLINTVVPVIGGTISEGLLSIQSYSSLIKSTVGIVGIISISLVFLPSILEVVIWRIVLSFCNIGAELFCDKSVSIVISAFRDALLLMNVILILSLVTTIISIGILISVRMT